MENFEVVSHFDSKGKKIWRVRIHGEFYYRCANKKRAEELSEELKKINKPQ